MAVIYPCCVKYWIVMGWVSPGPDGCDISMLCKILDCDGLGVSRT